MTTCIFCNEFGFGSRVFSAIQGSNCVNGTVSFALRFVLEKRAGIRQLTACPAMNAFAFAPFGNGQYCRKGPFYFGKPGIFFCLSHNLLLGQSRFCETKPAVKPQAKYLDPRFTWDSHSSDVENNVCPIGKEQCKDQNPGN